MKLGILRTGQPPAALARFGGYPEMFRALLGEDAYDYMVYDVADGDWPAQIAACPGYLITGSASGVYQDMPWIGRLMHFLAEAKGKAALIGICFGHQAMAQAFGGTVIQSPKGWGIGAHRYRVLQPQPWMAADGADGAAEFTLPASHQDQVVVLPPAARIVAGSDFCPYGMLAYADQPAISLQLHPEFPSDYAIALIEGKRGHGPDDAAIDRAIASERAPNDRARAAGWIRDFLRDAVG